MGADEGSSPLGKAYRPLASDRAAHSAPHTKRVDNTRTPSGAHTHMGSSPSTQVVSHSFTRARQHSAQHQRARHELLSVRGRSVVVFRSVVAEKSRCFALPSSSPAPLRRGREAEGHGLPAVHSGPLHSRDLLPRLSPRGCARMHV